MESFTGIILFNFLPHVGRSSMHPTGCEVFCISRLGAWSLQEARAHALPHTRPRIGKSYKEGVSVASAKLDLGAKATVLFALVGIMKTQPAPRPHMERLRQVEAVTEMRAE